MEKTEKLTFADIQRKLLTLASGPTMPETLTQLIALSNDKNANLHRLIKIIEHDPSLAVQIVRYAKSAYFGYKGDIKSIEQAVIAVLGFRQSLNIALGAALARDFTHIHDGPMGIYDYWQHSIYHAMLMEHFAQRLNSDCNVNPNTAFLCGLLHDFGIVVIGHLFSRHAILINQMLRANPENSLLEIEQQILGTSHTIVGAWLMDHWQLPKVVQTVVLNHHNPNYTGAYCNYVHLSNLADCALKDQYPTDCGTAEIPVSIMENLGFTQEDVEFALDKLSKIRADLNQFASTLAA